MPTWNPNTRWHLRTLCVESDLSGGSTFDDIATWMTRYYHQHGASGRFDKYDIYMEIERNPSYYGQTKPLPFPFGCDGLKGLRLPVEEGRSRVTWPPR